MIATHRVRDSYNKSVGFIVGSKFVSDSVVYNNILTVDNVSIQKNGVLRCKRELPIIQLSTIMKQEAANISKNSPFIRDIQSQLIE